MIRPWDQRFQGFGAEMKHGKASIGIPPPANSSGTIGATLGMYVCMWGQGLNARCVQSPKDGAYRSIQSFHARAANCKFVSIHGDRPPGECLCL
ncbi:hypothetical protein CEXT_335851 [Caerostris extrusa]|uniref:Uncharacterized protein n=1 Tax=Caerostris extrusa TaxID=172846 RepID=A0AAV4M2W2_CAEEX|nr:hypothetical protein CEXT_335851 [Caerostris extrusa]